MINMITPLAVAAPTGNHHTFIFRLYDLGINASDRSDDFLQFQTDVTCDEGDLKEVCRLGDNFTVLSVGTHYQVQIEANTSMDTFNYDASSTGATVIMEDVDVGDCALTTWTLEDDVGVKQFVVTNITVPIDGVISSFDVFFWTNETCPECNTTVDFLNDTLVYEERGPVCQSAGGARFGSLDFSTTSNTPLDSDPESPGTWPLGDADPGDFHPEEQYFWGGIFLVDDDWGNDTHINHFLLGGRMGDKDTEVGWSWNITTEPSVPAALPPLLATVIKIITQPFIQSIPANIVQVVIRGTHATLILSRPTGNVSIIQNRTAQSYVQAFATPDQIPGGIPFVKAGQGTTFTT